MLQIGRGDVKAIKDLSSCHGWAAIQLQASSHRSAQFNIAMAPCKFIQLWHGLTVDMCFCFRLFWQNIHFILILIYQVWKSFQMYCWSSKQSQEAIEPQSWQCLIYGTSFCPDRHVHNLHRGLKHLKILIWLLEFVNSWYCIKIWCEYPFMYVCVSLSLSLS